MEERLCNECGTPMVSSPWWDDPEEHGGACIGTWWDCPNCGDYESD